MNNSDHNDFNNWQNGDENEMNNPNNWNHGFFYYGPNNPAFRKMWENMNEGGKEGDFIENMKEYMNMNDILNSWSQNLQKPNFKQPSKKQNKPKTKTTVFSQEDYFKLIEIRGYLAITEQYAHVKALDKLLNQITIIPKDSK
jgi:hypothetical protein